MNREKLAEGYRKRTERDGAVAEELDGVCEEANEFLGSIPEWESDDTDS